MVTKERAKQICEYLLKSIQIQNKIFLSNRKLCPSVKFFEDDVQYYDGKNNLIHLGTMGPIAYFNVQDEDEYVAAVLYLFGHENQHVRSTASKPYENGIMQGTKKVIEYIAKAEGIKKSFRNDRDYEVFLKDLAKTKQIFIPINQIRRIMAGLINSIEDGRIERMRSNEFPGFDEQRRYFRGLLWSRQKIEEKDYGDLTPGEKFNLIANNILSLATTGLYMKGFVVQYANTPLMADLQKMMPCIARGVLSNRSRVMADNFIELSELIAPYVYEAFKMTTHEAMDSIIQSILSSLLSSIMNGNNGSNTTEQEEQTDDGTPNPVFSNSDLVITVDDETYDKLMEQAKKNKPNGNGASVMIKREHPKDEDGESDGETGGSGSDKKDDSKDKQSGSSSGSDSQEKDANESGSGSGNGKDSQNGSSSSKNGGDKNGDGDSSSESGSDNKPGDRSIQHSSNSASRGKESKHGSRNAGLCGGTEEDVLEQMKKAAEDVRVAVGESVGNINSSLAMTMKSAPVIEDTDAPISEELMEDICKFKERKREYDLTEQLPSVLTARARAFRKKNERYFKSLSTPNVSYLDSGSIDPTLIYGLTFGETNVFRKKGIDKKFDGCVYVLVDNSGSMDGDKRMEACKAAAIIEEGFKGLIPIKIVAFDQCGFINHEVIKGWEESKKLNCCWNFALKGRNGCGNDDGSDIRVATRELMARPEQKKLLIVLSDGAPARIEDTKEAIAEARKKGIHVFGIYFEEGGIGPDADTFTHMYEKDYVCCELSNVDAELTKLMLKFSRS